MVTLVATGEWVADPRLPDLGARAILPGSAPSAEGAHVIYGRQYRSWRIEHGIAEGNTEIPAGAKIVTNAAAHCRTTGLELTVCCKYKLPLLQVQLLLRSQSSAV